MEQEQTKKVANELLDKAFGFETDRTFTLSTKAWDDDELLFFKRRGASAQYLYAMHLPSKDDSMTYRTFDHIGIIAGDRLYLMANSTIPEFIRKELLTMDSVVSFRDEYEKASSLEAEMNALKELRENMPENQISTAMKGYENATFARHAKRLYFESYPNKPVLYERQGYLTPDDYAAFLCGLQNVQDAIRKNAHKSGCEPELAYIARKTEEELRHSDFAEDWEFAMIDALSKCKEKGYQSVMVSFKNHKGEEPTPYFKLNIKDIISHLASETGFVSAYFEVSPNKALRECGYFGLPACEDIFAIKCKGKEIYREGAFEKETEELDLC